MTGSGKPRNKDLDGLQYPACEAGKELIAALLEVGSDHAPEAEKKRQNREVPKDGPTRESIPLNRPGDRGAARVG